MLKSHPAPTPDFLTKRVSLETSLDWTFLLLTMNCPEHYSLSKENQVSLLRILFSETGSERQLEDLSVGSANPCCEHSGLLFLSFLA